MMLLPDREKYDMSIRLYTVPALVRRTD